MSSSTNQRIAERFEVFIKSWLAKLPPGGWTGSPRDLAVELFYANEAGGNFAYIPTEKGIGRAVAAAEGAIAEAGWTWAEHRTGSTRIIGFRKVAPRRAPARTPPPTTSA
ncbi:hypothetical protein [Gemmata sp.]|uniref:hypothetical protein n=1 Tax=Gemmata sp. TaxID=1914242 RepID=UPI003F6FAAB8